MKIIMKIATILLALSCLASCNNDAPDSASPSVKMIAKIVEIADKISVEVIEGEYGASGIFWIITSDKTEFLDKDGSNISKSDFHVGDEVEIIYGGQVMMSYPPQIVAKSIRLV